MARRYLALSLVAFAAYSLVAPLLKIAMQDLPSTPAVFLSNFVLLLVAGAALAWRGVSPRPYLDRSGLLYVVAIGVLLTIGLLTYYRALSLGPVSIVVPIYGLFIAVSSVIGIVALEESVTARKLAGIVFAVLAIVLMSI